MSLAPLTNSPMNPATLSFFLRNALSFSFLVFTRFFSTKYNKISHLVGGILMILMGILLILKPEWLMFNF